MSTKVKPCRRCGSTDRYIVPDRVTGPCKTCHNRADRSLKSYYKNRDQNMMDYRWRLNKLCVMAKSRAAKKDKTFNISTKYLIELWDVNGGRCVVSGRKFELEYTKDGGPHRDGPSLDRIDASKGYEIGNVRLVTCHVNTALSNFGEEALFELAKDIVALNGSVN